MTAHLTAQPRQAGRRVGAAHSGALRDLGWVGQRAMPSERHSLRKRVTEQLMAAAASGSVRCRRAWILRCTSPSCTSCCRGMLEEVRLGLGCRELAEPVDAEPQLPSLSLSDLHRPGGSSSAGGGSRCQEAAGRQHAAV